LKANKFNVYFLENKLAIANFTFDNYIECFSNQTLFPLVVLDAYTFAMPNFVFDNCKQHFQYLNLISIKSKNIFDTFLKFQKLYAVILIFIFSLDNCTR